MSTGLESLVYSPPNISPEFLIVCVRANSRIAVAVTGPEVVMEARATIAVMRFDQAAHAVFLVIRDALTMIILSAMKSLRDDAILHSYIAKLTRQT